MRKHWLTYGYESCVNVPIVHYTKYGNKQKYLDTELQITHKSPDQCLNV